MGSSPDFTPESMPLFYPKVKSDCEIIDDWSITTQVFSWVLCRVAIRENGHEQI